MGNIIQFVVAGEVNQMIMRKASSDIILSNKGNDELEDPTVRLFFEGTIDECMKMLKTRLRQYINTTNKDDEMLKKHFISDNLLLVNCISRLDLADECSEILNQIYGDFVEKGPNQLLLAVIEMYLSYEKYDDAEILIQKKLKQPGTTQSLTALLYKVLVIDCVLRKNGLQSAFKEVERIPDQYHIKQINCKT
eukprot:TRINITY_DN6271_c0_g1_i4.p1 TRINITY_DN6271_c0_g1~~TRINITY_DN6271_c0_g1_i4.p1  ORF type:complete len:193 (-),score=25.49 TRINITY_DN6271_c0_g1_i4:564-1142(-)